MKEKKRPILLILLLLLALTVACREEAANPEQLTFMAGFKAQANLPFVGAYVAQEKGFFADEGLDVTIRHSAGGGEHLQLLVADEVQVTTQDAGVLLKRRADPGLPLVSLALIGQRGQQAYVALAQSGITTPQQWAGHQVGYKGTPPPDLFAILDAAGLSPDDVSLVNVGFDPRVLTERLVDVYPVYKSNEPYLLRSWGYEPVLWDAADYGVPTLGLTYVATEEMVASRPEALRHFIHAAMRGISYAADHREEAVDIVLQYAEGADRAHMRFMLDAELIDFVSPVTDAHEPGWQTRAQWTALQEMLLQYKAMDAPVDVEKAFTNQFLPGQE
jgi:ABC-type nitrate/sulfonate/bicarbonate transport system substrate-binding protein